MLTHLITKIKFTTKATVIFICFPVISMYIRMHIYIVFCIIYLLILQK